VTIIRVGATKKYSDGWEAAFSKGKKSAAKVVGKGAAGKKAATKKAATTKAAKASTKKKASKKKK